jgi:hypothetical protein
MVEAKRKRGRFGKHLTNLQRPFRDYQHHLFYLTVNNREVLERFVVLMYDKTSNCIDVNSARKELLVKKGHQINNIPPTSETLLQHFKRAVYQGGHIWSQAEDPTPILPNPFEWGWQFVFGKWRPFWTTLPQASSTCQ